MDFSKLINDLDKILYILWKNKLEGNSNWLTAQEISTLLLERHGTRIHHNTIRSLLEKNRKCIERKKLNKKWIYNILNEGIERLSTTSTSAILIDPSKSIQATINLHDILNSLKGHVKICDPYIDYSSLEHLSAINNKNKISILSYNIKYSGTLNRLLTSFKQDGYNLLIKKTNTAILHDRYIIDDSNFYLFGTSLNGFGKKQSFIINLGEDIKNATQTFFDDIWNNKSSMWP